MLLRFIHALHLSFSPHLFNTHRMKYIRFLPVYISEMYAFEKTDPEVCEAFKDEEFAMVWTMLESKSIRLLLLMEALLVPQKYQCSQSFDVDSTHYGRHLFQPKKTCGMNMNITT